MAPLFTDLQLQHRWVNYKAVNQTESSVGGSPIKDTPSELRVAMPLMTLMQPIGRIFGAITAFSIYAWIIRWISGVRQQSEREQTRSQSQAKSRNDIGLPSASSSIHTGLSSFMVVESVTAMLAPQVWFFKHIHKYDFAFCSCVVTEVYCNSEVRDINKWLCIILLFVELNS